MASLQFLTKSWKSLLAAWLLPATVLLVSGCGGSSSSQTVTSVNVTPTTSSVSVNGQQQFTATALDSNGNTVSGQTFTWTSSNSGVASINTSTGIATGVAPGSTQITALTASVTSTAVTLTVNPSISTVSISPTTATIKVGETQQFTASAVDAQGNSVSQAAFSWHNSFGGVASIDSHGLATALAPGTVLITASANGVTSQVATLNVTQ